MTVDEELEYAAIRNDIWSLQDAVVYGMKGRNTVGHFGRAKRVMLLTKLALDQLMEQYGRE